MKIQVNKKFSELYGEGAILFASPGRINLIGEHTDYNGGFVFPGAVDKGIVAAIKLNGTDKVRAYALDLGESAEFGLNEADKPAQSWACYIFGVCTINLVKDELYDNFIATAKEKFNAKYGHEPKVYDVVISDGSRRL